MRGKEQFMKRGIAVLLALAVVFNALPMQYHSKAAKAAVESAEREITKELKADTFADLGGTAYYLLGDMTPGAWSAATTNKMSRIVDDLYAFSTTLDAGSFEFKAAPLNSDNGIDWNMATGPSNGNFKLTLANKSKVTVYLRTDLKKMWIIGEEESGALLDNSMLSNTESKLQIYTKSKDYTEANWPRLVGSMQMELGAASDWNPDSKLLMYDYCMDGTEFRYEAKLKGKTGGYEAKVLCGNAWESPNYGNNGNNASIPATTPSKVTFKINLSGDNKNLTAQITSLALEVSGQDFPAAGVAADKKVFKFNFTENVKVASGKSILKSVTIAPSVAIASVAIDSQDAKQVVVTLDSNAALDYETQYTFTIGKDYFATTAELLNKEYTASFQTEVKPEEGEPKADEFVGLVSDDTYVVTGSFQKLLGETADWDPKSKVTQMKRVTGDLYAYSFVLPASKAPYEFKIVKNGDYDNAGSFKDEENGGYGNYTLTLEKDSKVTFFVNTKEHKFVSNVNVSHTDIYYYNSKTLPRLIGSIQEQFGETAGDFDNAKQIFYDYNFDGTEYRLERNLAPAIEYTAKAAKKLGNSITDIGQELKFGVSRPMDTTFIIENGEISKEFNIYTPELKMDAAPSNLQKDSTHSFKATFKNEFKEVSAPENIVWKLENAVEGVNLSAEGVLTIGKEVPDDTKITVIAEYTYEAGFTPDLNKIYSEKFTVNIVPVVTNFTFNYLRRTADYEGWNLWVWEDGGDGTAFEVLAPKDGWLTGIVSMPKELSKINFITRKGNWAEQEGGNRIFDLTQGKEIWMVQGDKNVYYSKEEAVKPKIFSAIMNSANKIEIVYSNTGSQVSISNFIILVNGEKVNSTVASTGENSASITLRERIKPSDLIEVTNTVDGYSSKAVMMRGILDSYYYDGNDLGYTKKGQSSFKVWAPTAKEVSVALYRTEGTYNEAGEVTDFTPDKTFVMTADNETGVWNLQLDISAEYKYYMYKLEFANGTVNYAMDPYAKAVSANGQRTAILDVTAVNPEGWNPKEKPATVTYDTDNILYELHVRDFSLDPAANFKNKGKYLAFTETGLADSKGNAIGIDHLKELGVTTVHLLPTYDFRTVNELKSDDPNYTGRKYNWGYDPQNYNVPEGMYSTNPADPAARISEFKQMVQALHNANIRVVLDVVYNHTFDITTGPFDKVVPGYYYRMNESGEFTNGSGCGNEVASENPMVRKYILDSVKYWASEYNVDGFRFDLMGLIDEETASQAAKQLKEEVDPTIMVYGEPWEAGGSPLTNGVKKGSQKNQGYSVFNDDIRGAIKGGSDDDSKGFATGATGKENDIVKGIWASTGSFAADPTETINYVTAHDNLNLWDKVVVSQNLDTELSMLYHKMKDGSMLDGSSVENAVINAKPYGKVDLSKPFDNETVKRAVLANGMVMTMQGIPFIHAGDEFLRSKYGDHNSYRSPDAVNMIRWENKEKFKEVNDYYVGLMELRKTHPAFRMNTTQALTKNLVVCKAADNLVYYVLKNKANGDTWKNIAVIYNGNVSAKDVDLTNTGIFGNNWNVVVNNTKAGCSVLENISNGTVSVPGLSMMVLYDEESASTGTEGAVADFAISKKEVAMAAGEEVNVQIVYKNENGATLSKGNLKVASTDASIAEAVITDTKSFTKVKLIGKGAGSATITFTAVTGTGKEIALQLPVTVVTIGATITPAEVNYQQNPIIKIDTKDIKVKEITADLSSIGGSKKYEFSLDKKQISFGIKDDIKVGKKTIPIVVTDTSNKKYTVKASFTLVDTAKGFDWDEARIYFMMTDRFKDGNEGNNGILVDKYKSGSYHGGDFAGVTQKLDYLKELGINTIWLTPIVENTEGDFSTPEEQAKGNSYYAYHGYWATDFKELNPYLGTKEELCTLIEQAHDRDMKIMVDVVANHAGYFDKQNPLKDISIIDMLRDETINTGDEKQWIAGLPDFETENQAVRDKIINWQLAWAILKTNRGDTIDYYRVDTVKHVDHETWKQFKAALAEQRSDFKLIGEIFDNDSKIDSYLNNGEMDSALDFGFNNIAKGFVNGELESAETALETRNGRISNTAALGQFLSSHDEDGFLNVELGGNEAKMMAAAALQITAKGQPVIYYGEEIGASGANNWPVYDNRKDFDWSKVNDSNPMYVHYKKLLNIRSEYSKAFSKGSRRKVVGSDQVGYMLFARDYKTDEIYIGINTTNAEQKATFNVDAKEGTVLTDKYSGKTYTVDKNGKVTVMLPTMENGGTVIIPTKVKWEPETPEEEPIPEKPSDGAVSGSVTEKTENNETKETVTTIHIDKDGNRVVEQVKTTKDAAGNLLEETITSTLKDKKTGLVIVFKTTKDTKHEILSNEVVVKPTATEVMQQKDNAKIKVILPEEIKEQVFNLGKKQAGNKETKITIVLPSKEMKEQLENNSINQVSISLNQPSYSNLEKVKIESILLEKEVLTAAQKGKKDIVATITDNSGKELYSWKIEGELLKKSNQKLEDMNIALEVCGVNELSVSQKAIRKLILKDKNNKKGSEANGLSISYRHEGVLPASSQVKVYIGEIDKETSAIKSGSSVYAYYYNSKTGKLDVIPNNKCKVDKAGYITMTLVHCSDYILLPKPAAASICKDLLSQINLNAKTKTLYLNNTEGKSFDMITLPSTLVKISSFSKVPQNRGIAEVKITYKSANRKIAAVSGTGKIAAKKAGKTVITAIASLPDGKKKTFKTTVEVKQAK